MTPIYHDNVSQFEQITPGRPQKGGEGTENKKKKPNHRPSKTCASGGSRFFEPKSKKGQLELRTLSKKWITTAPRNHSKNKTKNHTETKAVSSAKCDRLQLIFDSATKR